MTPSKTVYVAMSADFLHAGHISIVEQARKLGRVMIGLLDDQAIAQYKRLPLTTYEQRKKVFENIEGVAEVVPQHTFSYRDNLLKYKPEIVVHGDDWKVGPTRVIRQEVVDLLQQWGGELVEFPYTKDLSSSEFVNEMRKRGITPEIRQKTLRRLLDARSIVRVIEVHNGLTGLIAENARVASGDEVREFDAMWESSLTDSASKGKPDTSVVDNTSRINTIDQILEVTTKPFIVDGDNGGMPEQFKLMVRTLERLGVSAVIIEDKIGAKKNSLFGTDVVQTQDSIPDFAAKITAGKHAQVTKEFMIIARIESLILKRGMEDALARASAYIEAGADGIMIHSSAKTPDEVLEFCRSYREFKIRVPLVVVPTTYNMISEQELAEAGIKIVIYANHLLRSAYPAMMKTALAILEHGRSLEADKDCMPIKQILTLIPEV